MNKDIKIYVAGHTGLVGSALLRKIKASGYTNIITRTHKELDLTSQADVRDFFRDEKPQWVILAAARVGGILANDTFPADFYYTNVMIENNVIHNSYLTGVKRLLFLGSSCIYPAESPQPIKEEYLLTGLLEPTNEAYAIAKISGLKACEYYSKQYGCDFFGIMPTNLYGINDNFDLQSSHLAPALIRKMHEAKLLNQPSVEIWGSGTPYRELMYVDDLADAAIFVLENYYGGGFLNVGTGEDKTIREIAELIKEIVGYKGELTFDPSKPDGMFRKVLDVSKLNRLGWKSKISLKEGLECTYQWFQEHAAR